MATEISKQVRVVLKRSISFMMLNTAGLKDAKRVFFYSVSKIINKKPSS